MRAAAFLEPTEEDGDFLTGPSSFLAAKAGHVVFFPGKVVYWNRQKRMETSSQEQEVFGTSSKLLHGAAAFLEPTEEDGDFFTGVLVSLAANNLVNK
jgi:hypothetical protein